MSKVFVATYVDVGETCDGKARVLGIYRTKAEALEAVKDDMENWQSANDEDFEGEENGVTATIDVDRMSGSLNDGEAGCEWNVEEADLD